MKHKPLAKIATTTLTALACGCATTENMVDEDGHFLLQNDNLRIVMPNPTADVPYYQGRRFTLPGMVIAADWQGTPLFTQIGSPRNPLHHDHVGGTAEEFDINGPAGYEQTPVGGSFMKIGVGFLERESDANYRFSHLYPIVQKPDNSVRRIDGQTLRFVQTLREEDGERGYRLEIKVELRGNGFNLVRSLQNLGRQTLTTEHYSHNFSLIGRLEVGPGYRVEWQTPVEIATANTREGTLIADENTIRFTRAPEGAYYYASAAGSGLPADEPIRLVQENAGLSLAIASDRPLHRIAIWGRPDVICPEPFVKLSIEPGETEQWTTSYTIEPLIGLD